MDERHKTILMHLVTHDTIWTLKYALTQCKLVQDESYFDYELLKAALARKHPGIVNFLLNCGCRVRNPNKVNADETPLHLAVQLNNSKIIIRILENGASIYEKNTKGETAIYAGFKKELYNAVYAILNFSCSNNVNHPSTSKRKKSMHPKNRDDIRHFHIACILNNLNAAEQYLNLGFDANRPFRLDSAEFAGLNPMHYAIQKNNFNLLELLLRYNGDLTVKNVNGQTPLHVMYYSGACGSPMLKRVFIYGNDTKFINCTDTNGVSNFHLCCTVNYPDLVKIFIDNGVDVNRAVSFSCPIYPGFTPLHFAAKYNCPEVLGLLLKSGADCNKADKSKTTALHLACEKINTTGRKIIQMLLDFNAYPAAADEKGLTPLHMIFYKAADLREMIINQFILRIPREVNFVDPQGLSHFHIVCTRDDKTRVKDFIESGTSVDSRVVSGLYAGYTALHFAVLCNQKWVVELLLQKNAAVNLKASEFGLTPLHVACKFYAKYRATGAGCEFKATKKDLKLRCKIELDIVKLLLEHGANVDARDCSGKTPLIQTCTIDRVYSHNGRPNTPEAFIKKCSNIMQRRIIQLLVSNGANLNARTKSAESILHVIAKSDSLSNLHEGLIEFLISKGADVNAVNRDGFTPLHMAVQYANTTLVRLFLKHRSNVNAKTKDGISPLEMAIDNVEEHSSEATKDVLRALLEHGANVNIRNGHGRTILQDAIENRVIFVIKTLLLNGADLNMKDSSGNSSGSSLIAWDRQLNDVQLFPESDYVKVLKIIFVHVQKLLAIGLHVNKTIQNCCISLLRRYGAIMNIFSDPQILNLRNDFNKLDALFDDCMEEVARMKLIKINSGMSLYDVLLKGTHALSKHVKNQEFVEILQDRNSFPLYSFLLQLQLRKALIRRNEIEYAETSLSYIAGFNLPDPCCDSILKYLTNEEIVNFNVAVPVKKGLEEKNEN